MSLILPPRCWAEIDLGALARNVERLRTLGPDIMAVVKADAYGHDVSLIAPALAMLDIRQFAVATVAEGIELRTLVPVEAQIYLIAAVLPEEAPDVVRYDLIPFVSDLAFARALSRVAVSQNRVAELHLEIDTGIGRAGVAPKDACDALAVCAALPSLRVMGICTHFTAADADSPGDALAQSHMFEQVLSALPPALIQNLAVHAANSPATLRVPFGSSHIIRPGLLLYGIAPSFAMIEDFPYEPVLSLKARALLVRHLPTGSDISYSRTYRLPSAATIATIGIGYGDGYPRRLSNIGNALLADGTPCPIRGRVCMDQLCIEVPDGANFKPGDVVTLIGTAGENTLAATEIADGIETTPHEITTCLTARVPRIPVNRI